MKVQPDRTEELRRALATRLTRLLGSAERQVTAIPRLTLHRRTAPTPPCHLTYEPGVIVVAQGRKQVRLGTKYLVHDPSCYLLTSVDLPTVASVTDASEDVPCLAVSLKLDIAVVREFLSHPDFHLPVGPSGLAISTSLAITTGPITAEFLDAWCRLLDLLTKPEDIPWLSGAIEREIVYRLLRGPGGERLRAIATAGDQSQRTARVSAWIKANYARHLRVEELAELAGMAPSTLHRHFRALTGMSPLQYQKQIRLQAARARMLAEAPASSTANTAASSANRLYGMSENSVQRCKAGRSVAPEASR
ncbi:MAG: AraC family transcriptional regulator [Acidobacteriia bacterium]|nr:AraC family transcriptional regulator [Terriglobia bacterium]